MDVSLHFCLFVCFSYNQFWSWTTFSYRNYLRNLVSVVQMFSALTLLTFWSEFFVVGVVLCILGCSLASLVSTLQMSVATFLPCLAAKNILTNILTNVSWWAKLTLLRTTGLHSQIKNLSKKPIQESKLFLLPPFWWDYSDNCQIFSCILCLPALALFNIWILSKISLNL